MRIFGFVESTDCIADRDKSFKIRFANYQHASYDKELGLLIALSKPRSL